MCEIVCKACRPTLGRLVKRHAPEACPLLKGSYCGLCSSYGHSPATCPDTMYHGHREPAFVEQLLPPTLIELYGITSRTPLKLPLPPAPVVEATMEVVEVEESLRAAIQAAGGKPMICQEKGKKENRELTENKKRLQKLADAKGQKLVFIAAPGSIKPAAGAAAAAPAKK